MIRFATGTALVVGILALTAPIAGRQQTVFRGLTDTVQVFVTVTDRDDRLVTTLSRDQFEVHDNGRPQPLTLFDNTPQPISLIVMLDVSGSMVGNLPLLQRACAELFARLGSDDVAKLGTFGDDIAISPDFTRDAAVLRAALPSEIDPGAPTPLWRGLDSAMAAFDEVDGRRVILVLSDGEDTGPYQFGQRFIGELDVTERARREDVMIYGVGMRSRPGPGVRRAPMGRVLGSWVTDTLPDPRLGRAALDTGGGYLEIRLSDDLGAAFARVADELHSQYLLGFSPPDRDGKTHKIDVRLSERDLEARARLSYQAPREGR